jgi:hypothetical protein
MSIGVDIERLDDELARFGHLAFVLTTSDDGRPHISHVALTHHQGVLRCAAGRHTSANVETRPQVAILWPPRATDGFSLIVDADARVDASDLHLTVTRAVLHRPPPGQ